MNFIRKSIAILTVVITSGVLINAVSNESLSQNKLDSKREFFPKKLDFAGEKVPLQIADVHERMDKELLIKHYALVRLRVSSMGAEERRILLNRINYGVDKGHISVEELQREVDKVQDMIEAELKK